MKKFIQKVWKQFNCYHIWDSRIPHYWESQLEDAYMRVFHKCRKCGKERMDDYGWKPVNEYEE